MKMNIKFTREGDDENIGSLTPYKKRVKRLKLKEEHETGYTEERSYAECLFNFKSPNITNSIFCRNSLYLEVTNPIYSLPDPNLITFTPPSTIVDVQCTWSSNFPRWTFYQGDPAKNITQPDSGIVAVHSHLTDVSREIIKDLITLINDLADNNICTSRCWRLEDFVVDPDGKNKVKFEAKLQTELSEVVSGENEISYKRDLKRLGEFLELWIKNFNKSSELCDLIAMMKSGNPSGFNLLIHPVLLSHRMRGNCILSIGREMKAKHPKSIVDFNQDFDRLKGYTVVDNTNAGRIHWIDRVSNNNMLKVMRDFQQYAKGHTGPLPFPNPPPGNKDYLTMIKAMGNAYTHLDEEVSHHGSTLTPQIIDCWISGTFEMALVHTMKILFSRNILESLLDTR